jgi:hypothetical protein
MIINIQMYQATWNSMWNLHISSAKLVGTDPLTMCLVGFEAFYANAKANQK